MPSQALCNRSAKSNIELLQKAEDPQQVAVTHAHSKAQFLSKSSYDGGCDLRIGQEQMPATSKSRYLAVSEIRGYWLGIPRRRAGNLHRDSLIMEVDISYPR